MRNKITNQLAGVTLFTSQLTTQNICGAEKVKEEKEEKEDPPTGITFGEKVQQSDTLSVLPIITHPDLCPQTANY